MTKTFGSYDWDANGLPCYRYGQKEPGAALDRAGKPTYQPKDPCFILGNYRATVFAHASGRLELISGERGWARFNQGDHNDGLDQIELIVQEKLVRLDEGFWTERTFGAGYACYGSAQDGIRLTRTVLSPAAGRVNEGVPGVSVEIGLENIGDAPARVSYREAFPLRYRRLSAQEAQSGAHPKVRYEIEPLETGEGLAAAQLRFVPQVLLTGAEDEQKAHPFDCFPPQVFLQGEGAQLEGDALVCERAATLAPGEGVTFRYALGWAFDGDAEREQVLAALRGCTQEAVAAAWLSKLPSLKEERDEALRWEMIWNAYVLECMATYHRYFGCTFIPQGMVYAYRLGQNAAGRDHCQHLLGVLYCDPALARSALCFVLEHECADGRILRQDVGYGYEDDTIYVESDPQLYLLMAMGEYLRVTGDTDFLTERVPWYPVEHGRSATVFQHLVQAFLRIRDVVGTGAHGLVRMLNSDWSDSFFHDYSPNVYSGSAESHMNTTMALAVLPMFVRQLNRWQPADPALATLRDRLVGEICAYREKLNQAFLKDMEGRVYTLRCYIGSDQDPNHPLIRFGDDILCLEAQPWILQMEDYPPARKQALWQAVKDTVLDREAYGASTRERPLGKNYNAEDGGIWFSHQGVLLRGVMSFSKQEAWTLLRKLSFHHFAQVYPDYWVGQWTAPDNFNSSLCNQEGLYWAWVDDAVWPFCAHVHAWMLYNYYALQED